MSLRDDLKRAWNALDYSHVGEWLPEYDKYRVLGIDNALGDGTHLDQAAQSTRSMPRRQVLISAGDRFSSALLDYAIATSRRIEAAIVLLGPFEAPEGTRRMAPWLTRLDESRLIYRVVTHRENRMEEVVRYVANHSEVVFALFAADDFQRVAASSAQRSRRLGHRFPVPLVVVAERTTPEPIASS
ncbi:MAG: hypothetical protein ACFCUJ_11855 [Thiotrichales bacterium]